MKLLSIIAALLIEQVKPFDGKLFERPLIIFARVLERWFNAGEYRQGVIAWVIGVLPITLLSGLIWGGLMYLNPLLAWAWNIGILYCTVGFRQQSHYFTMATEALEADRLDEARSVLSEWTSRRPEQENRSQLTELTIESAFKGVLTYVFAPIFWFVLLPGPTGVLLYRLSVFFKQRWAARTLSSGHVAFGRFFNQVVSVLNWPAVMLVAISFAIVGNFEDAIYACRKQAKNGRDVVWPILAAGAGALGIQFNVTDPLTQDTQTYGVGDAPEVIHLRAIVGLLWRALLLWVLLIAIVSLFV